MQGLNPSSVAFALTLYALCPSSKMMSGRRSRTVLPSEAFTYRPQKPVVCSKVSRLGLSASNSACAAGSSSRGKHRSKPPLSRNIRSVSLVRRLADGSMSRRMQRFSAMSRGPNAAVFSKMRVRCPDARSSCCRYGWSRSLRAFSVWLYICVVGTIHSTSPRRLCRKFLLTRSITRVASSVLPPPVGIFKQKAGRCWPSPLRRG